jgi:hypothetical protein
MKKSTPSGYNLGLPHSRLGPWPRQSASLVRTPKTFEQADAFRTHGIGKNSDILRVYQRPRDFLPVIVSRAAIFANASTIPEFVMTASGQRRASAACKPNLGNDGISSSPANQLSRAQAQLWEQFRRASVQKKLKLNLFFTDRNG